MLSKNCKNVLSTSYITNAAIPGNDIVNLQCNECFHSFDNHPEYMRGYPLNQAFIFHEDGFNAFVKKNRGMATIQLSCACLTKKLRSKGKFLSVYSFIPSVKIGDGIPHKLDAFFKFLIDEVVDLYINGKIITVQNPIRFDDRVVEAGQYQLGMLLLLGTADIKGHGDITLYAGSK